MGLLSGGQKGVWQATLAKQTIACDPQAMSLCWFLTLVLLSCQEVPCYRQVVPRGPDSAVLFVLQWCRPSDRRAKRSRSS